MKSVIYIANGRDYAILSEARVILQDKVNSKPLTNLWCTFCFLGMKRVEMGVMPPTV